MKNNIQHFRIRAGLTQEELAKKIGTTQITVSSWERGIAKPRTDMLIKMSEVFGVSMEEILGVRK